MPPETSAQSDIAPKDLIPAVTEAVPPAAFVASSTEPDLSEAGLAAAAAKAEGANPEPKPAKSPAKAKASETPAAAAAVEEPAPAAEPVEEAAPEPAASEPAKEEPGAGKLLTQVRAREKALVQKQTVFARERTEFESYKKASEARLEQARPIVEQANQVLQLAKQDPIALLKGIGWTEETIGERLLNGNKPGPREAETRFERELAEMRRAGEETRKALEAERAERQRLLHESRVESEMSKFVSSARAGEDRWPLASQVDESELRELGMEVARQNVAAGIQLSNEEILDKLEDKFSGYARLATKAKGGKNASAPAQASPSAKARTSPQATPGTARTTPAPTLTSAAAGERSIDVSEVDVLSMSADELNALTQREIERETARRKAARPQ